MRIFDNKTSYSVSLAQPPFSFIALSSRVDPETLPMLAAFNPITNINLSAPPLELSLTIPKIPLEVPLVNPFFGDLYSSYLIVAFPKPLETVLASKEYPHSASKLTDHLSHVYLVFAELY
jgi:hypothetical protein